MARYDRVAISMHWLIAILLLGNLALGIWMVEAIAQQNTQIIATQAYQLHKSIGFCVLGLSLIRLLWRLLHKPPPLPAQLPRWQLRAAGVAHASLYVLMLAIPLSGWLYVSTQWGRNGPLHVPSLWFGLFEVPHISGLNQLPAHARELWSGRLHEIHEWLAWMLLLLAAGHAGAALKHQFIDRDELLHRMLPQRAALWFASASVMAGVGLYAALSPNTTEQTEPSAISSSGWKIDPQRSRISFTGRYAGQAFTGQFLQWHVNLDLNHNKPESSRIVTHINTASASTGVKLNDETLREAEWFDVEQYPQARFQAKAIRAARPGQYQIDGELQIKNQRVQVEPLNMRLTADQVEISAELIIDRAAFELGMESDPDGDWVSREIKVLVELFAQPN